ncbi:3-oxoacyl- reductase FabG [Erysiphe neolycopersici]|uniref:3-oxoacyl-reductase FabG n=1 Tax=Erysiphe neolycopersici TaxID=212602 RepID=A0A420HWK2_9PEZI|nr:3-oxoacyl- reductase FabG [Erysiphe neolycopersici]
MTSSSVGPSLLRGTRALITGASKGIGAAIAKRFAEEGVSCILAGRNATRLAQVKDDLLPPSKNPYPTLFDKTDFQSSHSSHRILVGDVSEESFWKQVKREDHIDILVNAAGITHYSPLCITNLNLVNEIIQTNLVGTLLGCRTVGKGMLARKGGCIINVSSLLGLKGGNGSAAYAASKAGVIGLSRSLAAELGRKNIRVNVIVPGYIDTDMTLAMTPQARTHALENIPVGRFGQATEIADAAIFLACNKYANNCVLVLDGGLSAM